METAPSTTANTDSFLDPVYAMAGVCAMRGALRGSSDTARARCGRPIERPLRARAARLIHGPELEDRVNVKALEEFLVHGIKYAFPAEKGGMTRGMPTASAAEPLSLKMTQEDPVPVWPFEQGSRRGYAFSPLYRRAPQAALKDHDLYELLALVDALRDGGARERELAKRALSVRLKK